MYIEYKNEARRLILLILAVWLPVFTLLVLEPQLQFADGKRIGMKTAFINGCGVTFIILGILLRRLLIRDYRKFRAYEPWGARTDFIAITILLVASFIGAFLTAIAWRDLGVDPLAIGERTLYEMNVIYAQEERVVSGLPGRLTTMALIGLLYAIYLQREKRIKWTTALVFGICFIVIMISPRRALLLSALISAVMLLFLSQEQIRPFQAMKIIIGTFAIIVSFGFTQFLLNKLENFSILESIIAGVEYYVHSFYVMDALVDTRHFENTFIIMSVPERVSAFIFGYAPNVNLSIPFVYVPKPANTTPAFYYFYKSGGIFGVISSSLIIGWVFMSLYKRMRSQPTLFNVSASSLFATAILLSPRQCMFIEYDFIFLITVAFVLDWLRTLNRRLRKDPLLGLSQRPMF